VPLRRTTFILLALSGIALAIFLAAHWIMPVRLLSQPQGYFAPGYLADEHSYLQRMQPLIPGCTRSCPINGMSDPRITSLIFQDDILRAIISASGIHVITFFWIWRFAFIFVILAAMGLLAKVCFERTRAWARPSGLLLALLGTALLFGLYNIVLPGHPPQLFLNRVPTNMEFLTSTLLLCACIIFFRTPSNRAALMLAAAVALNLYLRPYVLPAWGVPVAALCAYVCYRDRLAFKAVAVFGIACALAMLPWLLVSALNADVPANKEWAARYFKKPEYALHPRWAFQLGAGVLLCAASAVFLNGARRTLAFILASGFFALPFMTGYPGLANQLNVGEDRFGCYFLPVIVAVVFMSLSSAAERWRGKKTPEAAFRMSLAALGVCLLITLQYAWIHWHYDVKSYPLGNYEGIAEDAELLPAYNWVREHAPKDALFIVDDAFNWDAIRREPLLYDRFRLAKYTSCEYFCVIAERRCTFSELMWFFPFTDAEVDEFYLLQRGTFGMECLLPTYGMVLKKIKPTHILWRKKSGVGRGMGEKLRTFATTIYSDPVCEIWKLDLAGPPAK